MSLNRSKPLYQPWNEEEFLSDQDVQDLNYLQKWMYRTSLQSAFFCATRPYLPDNDEQLWRMAGCKNIAQWKANKQKVLKMFTKVKIDGKKLLSQKRLLRDFEREANRRQALAAKGRKGGKAAQANKAGAQAAAQAGAQAQLKQQTEQNRTEQTELNRTELNRTEQTELSSAEGGAMNAFKEKITQIAANKLGAVIRSGDSMWSEMMSLSRTHGRQKIIDAFEQWADQNIGQAISYPLGRFLALAPGLLAGTVMLSIPDDTHALLKKLIELSQHRVLFDRRQQAEIHRLRQSYADAEIQTAFSQYLENIGDDVFLINRAGKDFTERAALLIDTVRDEQAVLAEKLAAAQANQAQERARILAMPDPDPEEDREDDFSKL